MPHDWSTAMSAATPTGYIQFFYAVDVAEAVNLRALGDLLGGTTRATPLVPRSTAPAYLQYQQAPIVIDGDAIGIPDAEGGRARFKVFDYGVVSVALRRAFSDDWAGVVRLVADQMSDGALRRAAEGACTEFVHRIGRALTRPQRGTLSEDYFVVAVHDTGMSSEELLRVRGAEVAQMVVGEREPLSSQEREEVLRHRMSYLEGDLLVPAWSAAFLYDGNAGAESTLDILEFANSQLLEFRYYDLRLDADLTRIYAELQAARPYGTAIGRRYERPARQLHSLFIEVSELAERTENALKFIGDAHAARLFALVAARLGLSAWKESVRDKLEMLDSIYRFTVEQSAMARGHMLELTIVLILVFELALVFLGVLA
jgi:hypothetical protein